MSRVCVTHLSAPVATSCRLVSQVGSRSQCLFTRQMVVNLSQMPAWPRGLLSQETAHRDVSVSTLRHELCHVDDFQRKSRLWNNEWLKERLQG